MPANFSLEHGHSPCSSQCSRKKTRGLGVLLGVSRQPRAKPDPWVGGFLVFSENQGVGGGGDFAHLIRVLRQNAVKSQRMIPVA